MPFKLFSGRLGVSPQKQGSLDGLGLQICSFTTCSPLLCLNNDALQGFSPDVKTQIIWLTVQLWPMICQRNVTRYNAFNMQWTILAYNHYYKCKVCWLNIWPCDNTKWEGWYKVMNLNECASVSGGWTIVTELICKCLYQKDETQTCFCLGTQIWQCSQPAHPESGCSGRVWCIIFIV